MKISLEANIPDTEHLKLIREDSTVFILTLAKLFNQGQAEMKIDDEVVHFENQDDIESLEESDENYEINECQNSQKLQ